MSLAKGKATLERLVEWFLSTGRSGATRNAFDVGIEPLHCVVWEKMMIAKHILRTVHQTGLMAVTCFSR